MNSTLDRAGSFQDVLRVKQAFPAAVYGEARKYPLDNVCEPDQRAYVKEPDGSEALLCVQNFKARITKLPSGNFEILFRKRKLGFTEKQFHQLPVVFRSHLFRDEDSVIL